MSINSIIDNQMEFERPIVNEKKVYSYIDVLDSFYEGRYLVTKDKRTGGFGHIIFPKQ